jgi:hypothetical protein
MVGYAMFAQEFYIFRCLTSSHFLTFSLLQYLTPETLYNIS